MIWGIGCDLVDIRRVEALHQRFGTRFIQRVFSAAERDYAAASNNPVNRYAKYLAAKEATYKALGTARGSGIGWQDMVVNYAESGKPVITLGGRAAAHLMQALGGKPCHIHLSLSDEAPYALAYVVIDY